MSIQLGTGLGTRNSDRGRFCVFDAKKMGKNAYSLKPMCQENAHWNQDWRIMKKWMRHFMHVLNQKDLFFKFRKDSPYKRNALNRTDKSPCQQLAIKIKALQSAFEVKDSAVNGMCRQVNLLT